LDWNEGLSICYIKSESISDLTNLFTKSINIFDDVNDDLVNLLKKIVIEEVDDIEISAKGELNISEIIEHFHDSRFHITPRLLTLFDIDLRLKDNTNIVYKNILARMNEMNDITLRPFINRIVQYLMTK
jgi:hypothetical protein